MRPCIIHVGTHKTGTTSLQLFLDANEDALRKGGLYLPRAGRPQEMAWGNHRLAWELLVNGESEDLRALLAELREVSPVCAMLTAEDLSLLWARPDALVALAEGLASVGYAPKILMYLRPQAAYAESMYVERIKQGHLRPVAEYLEEVWTTGRYAQPGSAINIEFTYSRLIRPFVEAFGRENVLLRVFQPDGTRSGIFRDLIATIGSVFPEFATTPLRLSVPNPKANESLTFRELLEAVYVHAHPGPEEADVVLSSLQARLIASGADAALFNSRFALFSRAEYGRFLDAFAGDNREVEREYGVLVPFVDESGVPNAGDPRWPLARVQREALDWLISACLEARQRA
ncbi:MAG TPA: hypothetical protein VNF68_01085 [Candidatus Baltobacteraceae bacterium]|nr:hypothetical protein [Candidatus Baltobacteraceae bacterium]